MCQDSWIVGVGNGTVGGGAGGAEWLGLCLKEVWVGVVGEAVGSGGGGGGGGGKDGLVAVVGVWDGGDVEGCDWCIC